MSVYSGFATRQQETFYNKVLERAIQLISFKLLVTFKKQEEYIQGTLSPTLTSRDDGINDGKWIQHFMKCFKVLHQMEKKKYLEPKFSPGLYPLVRFISQKQGGSTNQSILSQSQMNTSQHMFNFNDTLSMSSFISTETTSKHKRQEFSLNKLGLNKEQSNPLAEQFSMQEKSLEEEEDKDETAAAANNSIVDYNSSFNNNQGRNQNNFSTIDNNTFYGKTATANAGNTGTGTILEPLLKNKYSNRTLSVKSQLRSQSNNVQVDNLIETIQGEMGKQYKRATITPLKEGTGRRIISRQQKTLLDQAYKTAFPRGLLNTTYSIPKRKKLQQPIVIQQEITQRQTYNNSQLTNYGQHYRTEQDNSINQSRDAVYNNLRFSETSHLNDHNSLDQQRNRREKSQSIEYKQYIDRLATSGQKDFTSRSKRRGKHLQKINMVTHLNDSQQKVKFAGGSNMNQKKYLLHLNDLVRIHNELKNKN